VSRRDWFAAAVIAVVAIAIAAYLLRDTGADPKPRDDDAAPSDRVMSVAAADELMRRLTRAGWSCFDSLPEPVVKRCFRDQLAGDGTVSAEVALTYAEGYLARANVYAEGVHDGGRHVRIAEQAARLVGDVLLDGAGPVLVDRLGEPEEYDVAGRIVHGNRSPGSSIQVVVESASYDGSDLPPVRLPPLHRLIEVAEAGGLVCREHGATTTCSGGGPPSMTVTISTADARVGSLSVSSSNYVVPDDPAVVNRIAGYLFETGIGGPRAAAWVRQHADDPAPVRADLDGVGLRLGRQGDALYLSIGAITN